MPLVELAVMVVLVATLSRRVSSCARYRTSRQFSPCTLARQLQYSCQVRCAAAGVGDVLSRSSKREVGSGNLILVLRFIRIRFDWAAHANIVLFERANIVGIGSRPSMCTSDCNGLSSRLRMTGETAHSDCLKFYPIMNTVCHCVTVAAYVLIQVIMGVS